MSSLILCMISVVLHGVVSIATILLLAFLFRFRVRAFAGLLSAMGRVGLSILLHAIILQVLPAFLRAICLRLLPALLLAIALVTVFALLVALIFVVALTLLVLIGLVAMLAWHMLGLVRVAGQILFAIGVF